MEKLLRALADQIRTAVEMSCLGVVAEDMDIVDVGVEGKRARFNIFTGDGTPYRVEIRPLYDYTPHQIPTNDEKEDK